MNIPRKFWWWAAGVVVAWLLNRAFNNLADQKGARQKTIDAELAEFGLN